MRRISIRAMMAIVVVCAVAIAALRNADDYWASGMLLATPLLFGVALIGAACGEERARAQWLGFAILGGCYFVLVFLGPSDANIARLPTAQHLAFLHQKVSPTSSSTFVVTTDRPLGRQRWSRTPSSLSLHVVSSPTAAQSSGTIAGTSWASLLPGAADIRAFSIVGHCLFALLLGLVGGKVGVWYSKRRERQEAPQATD